MEHLSKYFACINIHAPVLKFIITYNIFYLS